MPIAKSDLMNVDNSQSTTSVNHSSASTSVEDRRRSERVDQRVPGWVSGESSDRSSRGRTVTITDISMGGVGFHDPTTHYRVGSTHWLVVNGGAMRMSTRIKVVSCRDTDEGGYFVGASFF